jgi:hypothetical protein
MISRKINRHRKAGKSHSPQTPPPAGGANGDWPVAQCRKPLPWYPAPNRLITLVRTKSDSFVLPPALVKKASWRD